MALFTAKGDGGTTKMFDSASGVRVSKSSELPEALGSLDELNAFLGLVKTRAHHEPRISSAIAEVQQKLFIVQAAVAGSDKKLLQKDVEKIENLINEIEQEIPPVKGFCVAGGTELSALLDVSRTIARRAERRITAIVEAKLRELTPETRAYMNRLSSLLFALARLANHHAGIQEENPTYS